MHRRKKEIKDNIWCITSALGLFTMGSHWRDHILAYTHKHPRMSLTESFIGNKINWMYGWMDKLLDDKSLTQKHPHIIS